MNCVFESMPGGCRCKTCGRKVKRHDGTNLVAACKSPSGLGDRVAQAIKLTAKLLRLERWVKETPGCGCGRRRQKLNAWGRWLRSWR
jgi:hypothetical protein